MPLMLKLIFISYPFVTNSAFDAFYYYRFDAGEYLRADVQIKVGTMKHRPWRGLLSQSTL